ncbi:S-formylglutathione hydrolase FrmB [Catenibacillus scindens]|uniref:S-formylglutathione hydrolase FrmB n=1 Tax=Catenibacillus scindens TaxID=673271 RepID=A0A7W8M564_9FIRM|nr:alpha/beta hydrolase family protein [Catenibacillus scindens]MBB5264745.1 S-formylglutathione hydrolase FrmB [Catenibacillus scindens]
MAVLEVNFISETLMRTVPMHVILPADKLPMPGEKRKPVKPFKTLYLLHGILGNYTDWLYGTRIQRWAEEKNLAVVMPSGDNASYVDRAQEHNYYGQFIGEELVDMTRKMFRLSEKREDTFIGGLSMGGYGALRNGLKYSETFGYVAALSSAFFFEHLDSLTEDGMYFAQKRSFREATFGKDLEAAADSDMNPRYLVKKMKENGDKFPEIYMACGRQDGLLEDNRAFARYLKAENVSVTYDEEDGSHEWDFWDRQIKKVLDWLPLDERQAGRSSGNVGLGINMEK